MDSISEDKKLTILIVSDKTSRWGELTKELSLLGVRFFAFMDMEQVAGKMRNTDFDVAVVFSFTDTGVYLDAIRQIRKLKHDLPIISILNEAHEVKRTEILESGADEILSMTVDVPDIVEKIKFYKSITSTSHICRD